MPVDTLKGNVSRGYRRNTIGPPIGDRSEGITLDIWEYIGGLTLDIWEHMDPYGSI